MSSEEPFQSEGKQGLFYAVLEQLLHGDDDLFSQGCAWYGFEYRIVIMDGLVGRREIVLVDRLAGDAVRDVHLAASVIGYFRAFENDRPVEKRGDLLPGVFRPGIPKLQKASPFVVPSGVEKEQKVELALKLCYRMDIVVDVDVEKAAVAALMEAVPEAVFDSPKLRDAGDLAQPLEEMGSGKGLVKKGEVRIEPREIVVFRLPFIDPRVMGPHFFQCRKTVGERIRKSGRQEVVDHQVPERGCFVKRRRKPAGGRRREMTKVQYGIIGHGAVVFAAVGGTAAPK